MLAKIGEWAAGTNPVLSERTFSFVLGYVMGQIAMTLVEFALAAAMLYLAVKWLRQRPSVPGTLDATNDPMPTTSS